MQTKLSKYIIYICLILALLTINIECLHLKYLTQGDTNLHYQTTNTEQNQQLTDLINIQNRYKQQIQSLNSNNNNIRQQLDQTLDISKRTAILQNAINKQRQRVGALADSLVGRVGYNCTPLPESEQQKYRERANQIQVNINQLQELVQKIQTSNMTQAIREQIRKMRINLNLVQSVSSDPCEPNLLPSSVVYTTNLYNNNNWVLGAYSMDRVIDEFYQIYLNYNNISSCPINRPFILSSTPATTINSCVQCPPATPYFDISAKRCIACPSGQSIDPNTTNCGYPLRNSNYTYGPNFNNSNSLYPPDPLPNRTSCPKEAPFFNGQICVPCAMPYNYWQVPQSKCYQCPFNQVFNVNIKRCIAVTPNMLTVLNNTQWIADNPSQVYTQRNRILQLNKTSGQYRLCPNTSPYYDSSACVNCNETQQFSMDSLQCTNPPYNQSYSKNMRRYVANETRKQMDPAANNYIVNDKVTVQDNIPYCNSTYPYYDGQACIYCAYPNNIFNYDTKQCTVCPPQTTLYNNSVHKCVRKPSIYVYGSSDRLLATKQRSLEQYNTTLKQAIANNPNSYPDTCTDGTYAAITQCVRCNPDSGSFFNVYTMSCSSCDGMPDQNTGLCAPIKYYFVNTDAGNILVPSNSTLEGIRDNNNKIVQANPDKYGICPIDNPFPYKNQTICGKCPTTSPLYSIESQGCTSCPQGQAYDTRNRVCSTVIYLTNYDNNVIIASPLTYNDLIANQTALNRTNVTQKCPLNNPYTSDGKLCITCFGITPYFDVKLGLCVGCPYPTTYSASTKGCVTTQYLTNLSADRLYQVQNYTIVNVKAQQNQMKSLGNANYVDCTIDVPYGTAAGCVNCTTGTVFNLKTIQCEPCPANTEYWADTRKCLPIIYVSNVNNTSNNIIQTDQDTLNNYISHIEQQKLAGPTRLCPPETPFAVNNTCTVCTAPNQYFLLSNQTCVGCSNYKVDTMTCPPKVARYPNLTNWLWVTDNSNPDDYISQGHALKQQAAGSMCPAFYNTATMDCVQCPANLYYNVNASMCQDCPSGTKFDINSHTCATPQPLGTYFTNIQAAPNQLEIYGGLTLNEIETTQNKIKSQYSNAQYCPSDKPFYDEIQCVACPQYKRYFNLRYGLCQVCLTGERLLGNDCIDQQGNKVWQEPVAQSVYPFLFNNN